MMVWARVKPSPGVSVKSFMSVCALTQDNTACRSQLSGHTINIVLAVVVAVATFEKVVPVVVDVFVLVEGLLEVLLKFKNVYLLNANDVVNLLATSLFNAV